MKIWTNTSALADHSSGLIFTDNKEEADLILLGSRHIDAKEFLNVKAVFRVGVGKDNVPSKELFKNDVVINYPSDKSVSYLFEETANFTVSLIFKMLYSESCIDIPWKKTNRTSLANKSILIIGTGNIGSRVANKISNFMKVVTFDIIKNDLSELSLLIKKSDVITLHIPSSPENDNFFDKDKLDLMKKDAILINTARANIVNEKALYEQLKSKRIRCAFDVFWEEPYEGILREYYPEYFNMTPHIASSCIEFFSSCRDDLDNMINALK